MRFDDGKTQAWAILSLCGVLTLALLYVVLRMADGPLRDMAADMANQMKVEVSAGAPIPEPMPDGPRVPLSVPRASKEAVAIDAAHWITTDDYPPSAIRNEEEGTVRATLDVDNDGRPVKCTVLESSGSSTLDDATCVVFMHRGRFNAGVEPGSIRRWKGRRVRWVMPAY